MDEPRSILVIVVSRIGDTLFATPAIRAIAAAYKDAHITVLGHPKRAEVFEHLDFIDEVGTITKGQACWRGRFSRQGYDLAFVYGFDEALVAYALRVARRVVAFRQRDDSLNSRLFRAVVPPVFQSEHAVSQLLRLPQAVDIPAAGLRIAYRVSAPEARAAQARLDGEGIGGASPLIGLQVASFATKGYRDWPVENFAQLCERIAAQWPGARFLVFGGPEERSRTQWLHEHLGERGRLFAGKLTLRETGALMSLTDLYVGVDTGPTHIMSAFDIPMVALYHCLSSSAHTGPLEHPCAYLLDHPRTGSDCTENSGMGEITVDAVLAQVCKALAEHPPRAR